MTFKDCETKEQILEKYKSTKKLNVKESKATEDVKMPDSLEYLITAPLEVRKVLSMDEATLQQSLNSADMNMQNEMSKSEYYLFVRNLSLIKLVLKCKEKYPENQDLHT